MTEAHAVDYMRESMASIMRVALLSEFAYTTADIKGND